MVDQHALFLAVIALSTVEMVLKVDTTKQFANNLDENRDRPYGLFLSWIKDRNSALNELLDSLKEESLQDEHILIPIDETALPEDHEPKTSYKKSGRESKQSKLQAINIDPKLVCNCAERFVKREADDENVNFRIIGGRVTKPHAFPQMANVRYDTKLCGGTILNEHFILTAAHCVQGNDDLSLFEIQVGRYDLKEPEKFGKAVGVKNAIYHPNFTHNTMTDDIALLELSEPITFNQDVKPTCLQLKDESYDNQLVITVGWGRTTENGSVSSTLRQVSVPVVPKDKCQQDYEGDEIDDSMICAGYPQGGEDACNGDSGGPLFSNRTTPPKQIGITSFGYRCARPGKPGVYSDVAYNLKFILDNSKVPEGCQIYSLDSD